MRYFTTETLGPSQSFTPEGFLLCINTPIGRLGMQIYSPEELSDDEGVPVIEPIDGVIRVERVAHEVFAPQSMASGRGKSVVNDHPQNDNGELIDVLPVNWKELSVGVVLDIRRGEGVEGDILMADLLISDEDAIQLVRSGKRQLSIGYNCDYYEIGPGRGEQRNIVINHVALVEQGRCGPRCSIADHAPGVSHMPPSNTWLRRLLLRAHAARDAAEVEKLVAEAPAEMGGETEKGEGTHIHLHTGASRDLGGFQETTRLPDINERSIQRGANREAGDRQRDNYQGGRDRSRDRRDTRRGRDGEGDPVNGRFEALEDQHEELGIRLDEIEDMLEELAGGGEGETTGPRDRGRDRGHDRSRDRSRDRRDERPSLRDRIRDRMRDNARSRDEGNEGEGNKPDPEMDENVAARLEEEAPEGTTGDRVRRSRDSALWADSFNETCAFAEIIAPGIALPTFDVRKRPVRTYDDICGLRRAALSHASLSTADHEMLATFAGRGKTFDAKTAKCETVRSAFLALGAAKKRLNTGDQQAGGGRVLDGASIPLGGKVKTLEDLQAAYNQHYGNTRA